VKLQIALALAVVGCHKDEPASPQPPDPPSALLDVPETEQWSVPGLSGTAYVIRTEGNVPRIYGENRADVARVQGFVIARDRYFEIDLARRLSRGGLSALLGDAALATDMESRGIGMSRVIDVVMARLDEDPELAAVMDGFAEGVNAWIGEARAGRLPISSEYETLGPLLGFTAPTDILEEFDREDLAAIAATVVYQLGFETGDVGRQDAVDAIPGVYADGEALVDLRRAGLWDDVWNRIEPVFPIASADGFGAAARHTPPVRHRRPPVAGVPAGMLGALKSRLDGIETRFGHDHREGFGSNAWGVAGSASSDGRALLAGDGHLPLSVPSLFYPIGLDTRELGDGDTHQVGLVIPGLPILAVGTNGDVAWSQTQLMGDITDWYLEEITLDGQGRPQSARGPDGDAPLVAIDEVYEVADVPVLGSVGRTEIWTRWTTTDDRWITDIEGRDVLPTDAVGPGESIVNLLGAFKVPADLDGDGRITAISFDYAGLDQAHLLHAIDGFGHASDVYGVREASRGLIAYSQNVVAADSSGNVLYTGYQGVPCRDDLPRDAAGWEPGADPTLLLDGTAHAGFTVPIDAAWNVDESAGCVVPFEAYPYSIDPAQGYVLTANNDIGGLTFDNDLLNEPYYVGGPWLEGYRANRIDERLSAGVGSADLALMQDIQADHHSSIGEQWAGVLLAALDDPAATDPRFPEVKTRIQAWADRGYDAAAGVETFYLTPEADDAEDAVATSVFNAWIGRFMSRTFDDEGWPGVFGPTGDTGRTRTMKRMLLGRGPGNPEGMASWNPDTLESAFFDVRGTPEIETSTQLALLALTDALDFLASAPTGPGEGGFGTDDMAGWKWGLRHVAKFQSILGDFLSADDDFGFVVDLFSIDTSVLPLDGAETAGLQWFPRNGDHLNIDAGNSGFDGVDFSYGSGPVFRMVFALGPQGTTGYNVIPGGTDGRTDSPHFADQAALWLANEALPIPITVDEVVAAGLGRETFTQ
jgi:penicillin amidase